MDILGTGNFEKSLRELIDQKDREKAELNTLFEKFTQEYEIPKQPILDPIDPESDYGRLLIASRVQLPKGSKVQPILKIQAAQAQYRRVELNELITIKKMEAARVRGRKGDKMSSGPKDEAELRVEDEKMTGGTEAAEPTASDQPAEEADSTSVSPEPAATAAPRYYEPPKKGTQLSAPAIVATVSAGSGREKQPPIPQAGGGEEQEQEGEAPTSVPKRRPRRRGGRGKGRGRRSQGGDDPA